MPHAFDPETLIWGGARPVDPTARPPRFLAESACRPSRGPRRADPGHLSRRASIAKPGNQASSDAGVDP